MTAEKDPKRESTVNKMYEPPSQEIERAFKFFHFDDHGNSRFFNNADAVGALVYLDSLPEHVLRALMYHARNGGL